MDNVIVGRWPGSSAEPPRGQSRRDKVADIVRTETGCAPERADFVAQRVLDLIGAAERA